MTRATTALGSILVLVACGSSGEPEPPPSSAPPPTSEAPPPPTRAAPAPTCALDGEPVALASSSGPVSVLAMGDSFVVAGYAPHGEAGEDFWLARVAPGSAPVELFRTSVDAPGDHPWEVRALGSAPALARIDDATIAIAVVTRNGEVSAGRTHLTDTGAEVRLGPIESGAAALWSPVVAVVGQEIAVAWTQASTFPPGGHYFRCGYPDLDPDPPPPPPPTLAPSEPTDHDRQVRLALLDDHDVVRMRRDATPEAAGAWAEGVVAIDGTSPPELVFDDPQSRLAATIHQVGVRGDGFVEPRTVRTLPSMHDAAMLAAAAGDGGPWLAYMAENSSGMTSIAIASLAGDAEPSVLVQGSTARMHVDAVSAGAYAIFAAEGPAAAAGSVREIHVRAVGASGPGEALVVPGRSELASSPALARRSTDGLIALAYLDDGNAATLRWVRCH